MESRPATMQKAPSEGARRLHRGLPEDIIVSEILVRQPPKSLLRCRAVCRAWHRATSTRVFLLAHHRRQPSLPLLHGLENGGTRYNILAFDHRATGAQLQPVARFEDFFPVEASCDGLLVLHNPIRAGTCLYVCNPATLEHAPLPQLSGFGVLGMYPHRPTGEYRLLLRKATIDKIGCYVYALGSNKPPRCIRGLDLAASTFLLKPALVRDRLHWYPMRYYQRDLQPQYGSKVVIVFDPISESFRHMCAPLVPAHATYIFEMDNTIGIYSYKDAAQIVDIWILENYESEVWSYKYSVKLPTAEIRWQFGACHNWYASVQAVDGDLLLLVTHNERMFYIDVNGKLVNTFSNDVHLLGASKLQLKQTLVPHTFFTALKGHDVNDSPFV